eukprot:SAG22_NODE_5885_length_936_cov_0.979689_1_plen_260_part_00
MAKRVPLQRTKHNAFASDSSCDARSFSHSFHGIQCEGFTALPNATTPAECVAACCAMNRVQPGRCKTWLLWNGGGWYGEIACKGPPASGSVGASMLNGSIVGPPPPPPPLPPPPPPTSPEVWARPLQPNMSEGEQVAAAVGLFNPNLHGGDAEVSFTFADLQVTLQVRTTFSVASFPTNYPRQIQKPPLRHFFKHVYFLPQTAPNALVAHQTFDLTRLIQIRDVWAHAELGAFNASFGAKVAPHGLLLLRLSQSEHTTP